MGSPPGEFGRGSNEGPVDVTLSRGFWMGKFEVTQREWQRVMKTTLRQQKDKVLIGEVVGEGPDHPIYFVSHEEAEEFCRRFTESEREAGRLPAGWEYRLPTEAEWEYACRAGTTTTYSFGSDASALKDFAWYVGNSGLTSHPIGQRRPNAWGLHDMLGNVGEWCADGYGEKLVGGPDPRGSSQAPYRVIRGGCWAANSMGCRTAYRYRLTPVARLDDFGFRVAAVRSGS
jgi:formylglycine-generating enzyme required for sulfatase activity